ncbi:MAG: universal stress protein [Candidatus Omnitrophica bacterium]|nr:universal stress protein [Candidatus Omnitrophota bacterium]
MIINNILVAIDGEVNAMVAVKYAICLAKNFQAQLSIVYVINKKSIDFLLKHRIFIESEAKQYEKEIYAFGETFLERSRKLAEAKDVRIKDYILTGIVHEEVINKALEIEADLIIIGRPGAKTMNPEEFYDEENMIIWKSPCPILSVKNYSFVEKNYKEL